MRDDCRSYDHALDAVVAALIARAAAPGMVTVPGSDQLDTARNEGWIASRRTSRPAIGPIDEFSTRSHPQGHCMIVG